LERWVKGDLAHDTEKMKEVDFLLDKLFEHFEKLH
jgi:hypothetical protein